MTSFPILADPWRTSRCRICGRIYTHAAAAARGGGGASYTVTVTGTLAAVVGPPHGMRSKLYNIILAP